MISISPRRRNFARPCHCENFCQIIHQMPSPKPSNAQADALRIRQCQLIPEFPWITRIRHPRNTSLSVFQWSSFKPESDRISQWFVLQRGGQMVKYHITLGIHHVVDTSDPMGMSENWVSYSYESNSTENLGFLFKIWYWKNTEQTPKNKLENHNLRKKNLGKSRCSLFFLYYFLFFFVFSSDSSCRRVFWWFCFFIAKINFLCWSRCHNPHKIPSIVTHPVISLLYLHYDLSPPLGQQIGTKGWTS